MSTSTCKKQKVEVDVERLAELNHRDVQFLRDHKNKNFYSQNDYHAEEEDLPTAAVWINASSMKILVGVYDLIYVKGEENDKNDEVNRAIKGSLEICMLPEEERIWGVVHYHDLDSNSESTFEQDFVFLQSKESDGDDDAPDGVRQWLKEKPWSLEVFTKDFECKWSPCEGDGYNTEYVEERKEFITLKLKQLLDVIFRRDGGGVADWTYTVARRRPDNEQGDLSKYIRPLCSEVKES
jgi:hypothetical protein